MCALTHLDSCHSACTFPFSLLPHSWHVVPPASNPVTLQSVVTQRRLIPCIPPFYLAWHETFCHISCIVYMGKSLDIMSLLMECLIWNDLRNLSTWPRNSFCKNCALCPCKICIQGVKKTNKLVRNIEISFNSVIPCQYLNQQQVLQVAALCPPLTSLYFSSPLLKLSYACCYQLETTLDLIAAHTSRFWSQFVACVCFEEQDWLLQTLSAI